MGLGIRPALPAITSWDSALCLAFSSPEPRVPAFIATKSTARPMRPHSQYPRELANWALVSVGVGAVEGAVAAALVKALYAQAAPALAVDVAVALVAGAPAYANLASFFFAAHQLGRDKIALTVRWQALAMLCVLLLALVPAGALGLWTTVGLVIAARVAWVGVITVRAVVWRNNFPATARARLASRLTALNAVLMAASSALLGWLLGHAPGAIPWMFLIAGGVGLLGAWGYRRMRLRAHGLLRTSEARIRADAQLRPSFTSFKGVLAADPVYRRYMQSMFLFGSGNLMLPAPLLLIMDERLALSPFSQVLLMASLPFLVLPFAIMAWARFYDRVHIVEFRSVHAWSFVLASAGFLIGCISLQMPWLIAGSVLLGVSYAGGQLGWNLGHNDFARPEQAALYMGVHVTLTGMRGLAAPLIGVALYRVLETMVPGRGHLVLILPLLLNIAGALSFVSLRKATAKGQRG